MSNQRRSTSGSQAQSARESKGSFASDTVQEYKEKAGALADQATEYWSQGQEQLGECVKGREGTAIMLAVAAGVGVGLIIGTSLGHSRVRQQSWRERYMAEGFGRRLMERIENMIPDALSDHFSK